MTVELTFQRGVNSRCTSITIANDPILENDETLLVLLTTTDEAIALNPSSATITIEDNDSKMNHCNVLIVLSIGNIFCIGKNYLQAVIVLI